MAECLYDLARIKISRRCNGYYLRWYYNGWHYWLFATGKIIFATTGEKYRTLGTQKLVVGSTQLTLEQTTAIRTITNTREIYIYTDAGWGVVRLEAANWQVFNNQTNGYDIEITLVVGSRAVSSTGFSPAIQLPVIDPSVVYCELDIPAAGQIWMCKNWESNYPGSRVYEDEENNRSEYGGLYTYDQVMTPGFVPDGWHVPTVAEWNKLFSDIGGATIAGGELKEIGTTHWDSPNTGAVDTYGFAALANGYYDNVSGTYISLYKYAWLLTADEASPTTVYLAQMEYNSDNGNIGTGNKNQMFGLRLIKNITLNPVPPVALAATNVQTIRMTANWNAYTDATNYYLDVSTNALFSSFVAGYNNRSVGNVTSHEINGLTENTQYYYRVRAEGLGWQSVNSNTISQTSAFGLGLITRGDGSGVTSLEITTTGLITLALSGVAKFYSDPAGTLNESSTWNVNGTVTLYMRCSSGSSIFTFSDASKVTSFGGYGGYYVGTVNSPALTGNPITFPNLVILNMNGGNQFTIQLSDLPASMTIFRLFGGTSLTGDLSDLPAGLLQCSLGTAGLITGALADLPVGLTSLYIDNSTTTGDMSDLPVGLTELYLLTGTYTGALADLPSGLLTFNIASANTISGNITDFPANIVNFYLQGSNTITGDIVNFPASLLQIYVTGSNTITGDLSDLTGLSITMFRIFGSSSFTGALSDLPATLVFFEVSANTISGSLNDLPASMYWFYLKGNNTVSTYVSGRVWDNDMWYFYFDAPGGSGLDSSEVDNLLIDLAVSSWNYAVSLGGGYCRIAGNNAARTIASDAAVATLIGLGITVVTN